MVKIIISIAVIALSTYMGYKLSDKYVLRRKFYFDILVFNDILKDEINFTKRPIKEIVSSIKYNKDFSRILNNYLDSLKNNKDFNIDLTYLTDIEKNILYGYFNMIGKSDAKSQEALLINYKNKFNSAYEAAEKDEKKFRSLFIKLGFLIGLIILIIII